MTFHLRVMYQVAIGWRWGSTPPWSAFWPWHLLDQLKPFWGSKHVLFQHVFAKRHFTRHTWQSLFSFSLLLQKDILLGLLDKHVLFCKLAFCLVCLTKHVQMKHEKGVGCFMVHKSEVGRAWEGSKWFPKVLWEPLPTPLLGTMRNTQTPFYAWF